MTTRLTIEETLCREWEEYAATLSVLLRAQDTSSPSHSKIDRVIEASIASTKQEMVRIFSELASIEGAHFGDTSCLPVAC